MPGYGWWTRAGGYGCCRDGLATIVWKNFAASLAESRDTRLVAYSPVQNAYDVKTIVHRQQLFVANG